MKILNLLATVGLITIVSKVAKIAIELDRKNKKKKEES